MRRKALPLLAALVALVAALTAYLYADHRGWLPWSDLSAPVPIPPPATDSLGRKRASLLRRKVSLQRMIAGRPQGDEMAQKAIGYMEASGHYFSVGDFGRAERSLNDAFAALAGPGPSKAPPPTPSP